MLIEITYNVTDVYMSTTETPVYVEISFEQPGSASAVWGSITGTLSNQTDLQNALNAKFDDPTGTSTQYIDGTGGLQTFPLTLPVLQEVRNQTGATLDAGTVVYINGATGNKPTVTKAIATGDATSAQTLGMISSAIANNGVGYVVVIGTCGGLDTSAYTEGQQLYLSGTVAGGVTTTKPYAPIHLVYVGIVTRAHPNLGTIEVRVQNGIEVDEIHNVSAQTPSNNDGLFYNTTTSLWESKSITTALGYTPVPTTRNITINGVTYDLSADRTYTISTGISGSGAAGQVTYWTGASAVSGSSTFLWNAASNLLRVNGGIGVNRDAFGGRAIDVIGGGIRLTGSTNGSYEVNGSNASFNISTVGAIAGINITDTNNARISLIGNSYNFELQSNASLFRIRDVTASNVDRFSIHSTGNIGIGFGSTDPAVRFGVSGDTLLRGSGNTSATTALTVQNSDSNLLFRVSNSGVLSFRTDGLTNIYPTNDNLNPAIGGNALRFSSNILTTALYGYNFVNSNSSLTWTTGTGGLINVFTGYAPTSGNGQFRLINLEGTINQTGGANGITRGLYVNPTLTAAADWRSIEWSNNSGWGLYGAGTANNYVAGNFSIGTTSVTNWLNIAASTTAKAHINLAAGSTPTAPANGDIWFDGTDIKMRIGGVTKTFTLL